MSLGLFVPGVSPLHRAAVGAKLAGLAILAIAVSTLHSIFGLFVTLGLIAGLWALARLSTHHAKDLFRPLLWFLVPIAGFQWWARDLAAATQTVLAILVVVMAAGIVSLTTRPTDMLEALRRWLTPLRSFGVNPDAVSFAVTYAIRLVPVIQSIGHETGEAITARGGGRNPAVFLAPFSIRLLRQSDALAEALDARGFGDGGRS